MMGKRKDLTGKFKKLKVDCEVNIQYLKDMEDQMLMLEVMRFSPLTGVDGVMRARSELETTLWVLNKALEDLQGDADENI